MTCIVGIEHDGQVTIGGDSAITGGWRQNITASDKVFRVGDYLIGSCGSVRAKQLIRYGMVMPEVDTWDLDRFMATTFVDALRATLKEGGHAEVSSNVEKGGTFLVAVQGRLYSLWEDYQVQRYECGSVSIGCGDELAMGSLHTTAALGIANAVERVTLALDAASEHSAGVGGRYTILTA